MADRDSTYVPRYINNPRPRRYTLAIASEVNVVTGSWVNIDIEIHGVDNQRFQETNQMRHVGRWSAQTSHSISATGGGLFYFDLAGSATLTSPATYENEKMDKVWSVEEVMYLTSIDRQLVFMVGDSGKGEQIKSPCGNSPCIQRGRIVWKCIASSIGRP
jgi:hypothetical protein